MSYTFLRVNILILFIVYSVQGKTQDFIKIFPHPNYGQAFAVSEDNNSHGIIASTVSVSPNLSSHLTNNILKIYKFNFEENTIVDSLEVFPPDGQGITQVVNISEGFPSDDRFIISGSYQGLNTNTKDPFFILIDADLNILNQTSAGLSTRREALYQDIILNDSTILYHGCIISDVTNDCSIMYQVTLNGEGDIINETVIDESEDLLRTSFITKLSETFIAQDAFDERYVFLDTETFVIENILEDPYQQSGGTSALFRAGNRGSFPHPTEDDLFIVPGRFTWLNSDLTEENHHGFHIFSEEGEIISSVIPESDYQTDYDFDNIISDDDGNLIILAQSRENLFGYHTFYLLQKISLTGDVLWEELISLPDGQRFILYTIESTSDGGLVMVGSVLDGENIDSNRNSLLLKVNQQGNMSSLNAAVIETHPFIYPNPTHNYISVKDLPSGNFTYEIFDLTGKLLKHGKYFTPSSIDIQNLAAGEYMLSLSEQSEGERLNLKFMVTDK